MSGDRWKLEVMKGIGLPAMRLKPREWALLLLYADGQSPVRGEECFHMTFFMMQVPPVSFKPLLLSFFSPELHGAIRELVEEGLVKAVADESAGTELYRLTERGLAEAAKLVEEVKHSWVFVGSVLAREGSKVLGELDALKKTYNGKDLAEWVDLLIKKIDSQENILERVFDGDEISYLKKIFKQYYKAKHTAQVLGSPKSRF